jgi:hypothetical protein
VARACFRGPTAGLTAFDDDTTGVTRTCARIGVDGPAVSYLIETNCLTEAVECPPAELA